MREVKRVSVCLCLIFMLSLLFGMGKTEQVQAEQNYKTVDLYSKGAKTGGVTFEYTLNGDSGYLYAAENGERVLLASGAGLSSKIITDGTTVYYHIGIRNGYSVTSTVYSIRSDGKKKKSLFSVKEYISIDFAGYYNGKIFYTVGELDEEKFCSYHVGTRKKKTITEMAARVEQCGQYFYLTSADGDFYPILLRVYNAKNGKVRIISKGQFAYVIASNSLYYVESKSNGIINGKEYFDVAVKRCKLSGSNKKTLVKDLRITGIVKIRKNSITYFDVNGKKKTRKF